MSFGGDAPSRSGVRLLIGVAVACLLVGFLAGRTDVAGDSSADSGSSSVHLVAGPITNVTGTFNGADFALPVLNSGGDEIEVTLVDLAGWDKSLRFNSTATLPPDEWGQVAFRVPADCRHPLPHSIGEVTLRVDTANEPFETEVPLPDARTLLDYQNAYCAESRALRPQQLAGVWIVEKAYGEWVGLGGVHLMRFNPDGTFVADPEGGLFSRDQGVYGTYQLDNLTLTTTRQGGYASCRSGETAWRVTLGSAGRLLMAWERGQCPDGPGDVWIARRILRDVGLPAQPPGTAPATA